ncbi:hypothetical protein XENTR_v10014844 [Xenopus tropicalis]|uniref:WD repeat domain 53 n=1 Tax=Xenopus tropicalis TaxID=8364 RepID=A0A6I8S673_XENTR|nr:WD repeat-containing protein 53 [Xenopus tropicalis]KAE8604826.1 hypothetical protein XENTR_v10014844 [Xenopus tropicalis]|eukprot:XP_002935143.1 PREDICTED: WD repeat-containing protein 53 [Xenopus tropicalis]
MPVTWTCPHSNAVLCLAVSTEGVVASGAELGELTIWNEEGHPIGNIQLNGGEDVTSIAFSPVCATRLYVSHGENISVLDSRAFKEPVETFIINKEEVNCISVNETDSLLAAADDSGSVKVLDLEKKKVTRSLHRHTNICSAVSFRPHWPHSLVSCGLDMQVLLWNVQKARPLWITNLQHLSQDEEDTDYQQSPGQLFNPPLAHSLSVAASGNTFCCGAEDGKIRVFQVTGTRFEEELFFKGHTQGVSQVHFLKEETQHFLISGGNDGKVCLWDTGKKTTQQKKQKQPKNHHLRKSNSVHAKAGSSGHKISDVAESISAKLSIEHGEKINWVSEASLQGSRSVLVADPTNCITVYQLGEM